MRLMIMDGNRVANVIVADPDNLPPEYADLPEAPEGVGVGMLWDGEKYKYNDEES